MQLYSHNNSKLTFFLPPIFDVNDSTFEAVALEVYRYQFRTVKVYREFCELLGRSPNNVKALAAIPFLPIEFFKTRQVMSAEKSVEKIFESSGTIGEVSKHCVADIALYEQSFLHSFQRFYGNPEDYVILALLPSYLERENSSLVYMAEKLIQLSKKQESGFFLHEMNKLYETLAQLRKQSQKVILLGVTFALLDFAERYTLDFPNLIVMETGGMKGRREEITRDEVHQRLMNSFGVSAVHSEYGMTELLSQAYSAGNGVFQTPPWMRVLTRDIYDPVSTEVGSKRGALNIIDLANIYSCSFIATSDLGKVNVDGTFEVLGRMDNAEIRGCNLMVSGIL